MYYADLWFENTAFLYCVIISICGLMDLTINFAFSRMFVSEPRSQYVTCRCLVCSFKTVFLLYVLGVLLV